MPMEHKYTDCCVGLRLHLSMTTGAVSPRSDTDQSEDAVRVYSSTPLGELQDLTGLALAYFRAGLLQESLAGEHRAVNLSVTLLSHLC